MFFASVLYNKLKTAKRGNMKIIKYPDPILRQKARPVPLEFIKSEEMKYMIRKLTQAMVKNNGMGLSAIQLGFPYDFFIYRKKDGSIHSLFNAKILARSGKYQVRGEGCLSIPGYRHDVKRSKMVVVTATTLEGKEVRLKEYNMMAAVLQHEIDHQNGILFIDRVKSKEKNKALKSLFGKTEEDLVD